MFNSYQELQQKNKEIMILIPNQLNNNFQLKNNPYNFRWLTNFLMRRSFTDLNNDNEEWQDCFGQNPKIPQNFDFVLDEVSQTFEPVQKPGTVFEITKTQAESEELQLNKLLQTFASENLYEQLSIMKLNYNKAEQKPEQNISKGKRPAKQEKSSQYSKNYRQKKKERVKQLQEQNEYLKRKVDDLQSRLREKQMELNRIKFVPQDEFNIQKLNEEITKKLTLIADHENEQKVQHMKEQTKQDETMQRDTKISEWLKIYTAHGIGGSKTMQLLEYYMNELLENVLRDIQKYYVLKGIRNQKLEYDISSLDIALMQFMEPTSEEQQKTKIIFNLLRPHALNLKDACRSLYKDFKKVVQVLETIHSISKHQYGQDLDTTKKTLKMLLWFQVNQHTKEIRNLRNQWIDMIKSNNDETQELLLPKKPQKKFQQDSILEKMRILNLKHKYKETLGQFQKKCYLM